MKSRIFFLSARFVTLSGLLILSGLQLASRANAQTQAPIITIDVPGAGTGQDLGTVATAINASGAIAGLYFDGSHRAHGFVRNPDGTFVFFDSPLSSVIYPASINDAGEIAGYYLDGNFGGSGNAGSHGFVRMPGGTFTTFDAPIDPSNSNPGTIPLSINSTGQITGTYYVCNPNDVGIGQSAICTNGFLQQADGTIVPFAAPNGQGNTSVGGINATGTIAGYFTDSTDFSRHGFLRAPDGTFTIIDVPGASATVTVAAINSSGEVAGSFFAAGGPLHNFLRTADGTFAVFDVPGACPGCFQVAGLNDRSTVVGTFQDGVHSVSFPNIFVRLADGTFAYFTLPGSTTGYRLVAGINSSNAVVGTYQDANRTLHGYLRLGGPGIRSFTPTGGPAGTAVTITGTGFTGATRVAFNRLAASFSVDSDTQIMATVPGGASTGPISVTTASGTGWTLSTTPFTVDSAGVPTITSFSPASGSAGLTVTLTGTNFTGTTGVSFNGTPATTIWGISDTQFNAKVPSGATSGRITLTNSLGSAVSATNFTMALHIRSFAPSSGPKGTTVTITGTGFTGATAVTFFRVPASFTVVSDTQIMATVPGGALSGWISVKTANGTAWSSSHFTATSAGSPTITSFSPASASAGWTVTLTGMNFTGTTGVNINGTAATTFWATSDTQLNVKVPSGATSGAITVTNTAGTTHSASSLTVK